MDLPSIMDSTAQLKQEATKISKNSIQLPNKREIRSLPTPPLLQKQTILYYEHIPMAKSLPQWNISSTTLQHSSSNFRFSRSDRFPTTKCNYQDTQQLQIPSTLGKRSTSLGICKKLSIPQAFSHGVSSATKDCPFYNISNQDLKHASSSLSLRPGKTFGLGWKHFQASRTPHRDSQHSSYQVKQNPGPNRYQINPQQANKYSKIKIHQRLKMFTDKNASYRLSEPHPQSYEIKQQIIKRERSTSIGFGFKTDFTKLRQSTPGPIYNHRGFCDNFTHLKLKLKQR